MDKECLEASVALSFLIATILILSTNSLPYQLKGLRREMRLPRARFHPYSIRDYTLPENIDKQILKIIPKSACGAHKRRKRKPGLSPQAAPGTTPSAFESPNRENLRIAVRVFPDESLHKRMALSYLRPFPGVISASRKFQLFLFFPIPVQRSSRSTTHFLVFLKFL
jgi:hypothetical protein